MSTSNQALPNNIGLMPTKFLQFGLKQPVKIDTTLPDKKAWGLGINDPNVQHLRALEYNSPSLPKSKRDKDSRLLIHYLETNGKPGWQKEEDYWVSYEYSKIIPAKSEAENSYATSDKDYELDYLTPGFNSHFNSNGKYTEIQSTSIMDAKKGREEKRLTEQEIKQLKAVIEPALEKDSLKPDTPKTD